MQFPISAIRHVPGSATSACEITLTKANADLFQKVAERALALATGLRQFGARGLVAEDAAFGLVVRYQQGVTASAMTLRTVTFDCGSGRDPFVTLTAYDGSALCPSLTRTQFETLAAFNGAGVALSADEVSCAWCGFTQDASALATRPECAMCAKPAAQPAEAAAAA